SVSLLEVVVSYTIDNWNWKRKSATVTVAFVIALVGVLCSLANGPMAEFKLLGMNFFDFMDFLAESFFMPLGGMLMCIFIGYVWGMDKFEAEVESGGKYKFVTKAFMRVMIKYLAPVAIFIIWIKSIWDGISPLFLK
ncbi:MAG: sodium-dependent transporter, partial [Clostridioides sp.]|nr:sodium-dependent transporter [Clostridioides sp.]